MNEPFAKLAVLMLIGSFTWTGLVRAEDAARDDRQQMQLDSLVRLQQLQAAQACATLPTEEERKDCLLQVYPPPPEAKEPE